MKQKARTAPASMTPYAIYMDVITEYVYLCLFSFFLKFAIFQIFYIYRFGNLILNSSIFRWQKDPLCNGPYPKTFSEFKKTLTNIRKRRYGKNPTNGEEVLAEFQKEEVLRDYGYSLLQDHGKLLNDVIITKTYENCIFSSAKSIALIKENVPEHKRFFILDGTFYITPKGVWKQVLILHARFGSKVSQTTSIL